MSSIQDVSAEELAKLVHHYQGALAGDFGCESQEKMNRSWEQTSPSQRKLMITAARLALLELSETRQRKSDADYFAKPGEADWGC
jgi:hypothetical protein